MNPQHASTGEQKQLGPTVALLRLVGVRLLGVVFILLVVSILTFGLMYLAPGDLVKNLLGNRPTSPEAVASIREQYRLDDPFIVQYGSWLLNALQGNFGTSVRMQQPVSEVLRNRMGLTIALCLLAFVIAVVVSVPLGVLSATKSGTTTDRVASALSLVGLSAPTFALALLALYLFAYFLPIFPVYGGGKNPLDTLYHLVLPAAILAAGLGAIMMRMTRAAMIRELASDAVAFARARGISEKVVQRIALRAAAIPIVTGAGLVLTFLVGGTIIVETIFALPGLGSLLQDSVLFKDIPVVQALTLLVAAVIAVIAIVVDLSYLALDPRVRTRELAR